MGKKFMGYDNASELLTAIGNKIKAKYTKPNTGIPKSDLETAVQTSLDQISTNQTNILYNLNMGVKNLCPLDTLTTSGGETNHADVDLPAGTYHIYCTTTASTYSVVLKDANNTNLYYRDHSVSPLSIDVTITGTAKTFYFWNSSAATFSNVMICPKVAWDAEPNVYQPYAVKNSDLTYLEKQDRAAIAEIINNGTKNLWNFPDASYESINKITVTDNSDGSKTFTSGDGTWQRAVYKLNVQTTGRYYLAFSVKNSSFTSSECYIFAAPSGSSSNPRYGSIQITGDGKYHTGFNVTGDLYIWVYLHYGEGKEVNSITLYDVMLCTMTDCNVTDAVVPYNTRQWQFIEKSFTSTAADTYENSGVSFTVPANQIYEFIAVDRKEYGRPTGIILADNGTDILSTLTKCIVAENNMTYSGQPNGLWARQITGMTMPYIYDNTFYVWVKRYSADASTVMLAYRRIK